MSNDLSKKIIALGATDQNSAIKRLVKQMADKHDFDFVFVDSSESAGNALKELPCGILICEVTDKKSLSLAVNTLKKNKKILSRNHIKVGSFNHLKNPQVEKGLKKLAVDDFFDIYINSKSFAYKLDFWFKTLKPLNANSSDGDSDVKTFSKSNKNEDSSSSGLTKNVKGLNGKKERDQKPKLTRRKSEVLNVDQLDNDNDMWLLEKSEDCKNILRRWLIKLAGPPANTGKWEQQVLNHNRVKSVWKFIFNDDKFKDMFNRGEGLWCFDGGKPEFDWNEKKWIFSGSGPSLFYENTDENENYSYRFQFDNGVLLLAKNSSYAQAKKHLIEQATSEAKQFSADKLTEDAQKNIKNNNELDSGNLRGDVTGQDNIDGHMYGVGSTDRKDSGFLSGEIGDEVLNDQNLEGSVSDKSSIDNYMRGSANSSTDIDEYMEGETSDSSDLGGNYSGATNETESIDTTMGGKNNFKEDIKGRIEGGRHSGRNHKGNDSLSGSNDYYEEIDGEMDGSVDGTDNLGPSHYGVEKQFNERPNNKLKGRHANSANLGDNYYEDDINLERKEDSRELQSNLIGRKVEKDEEDNFDPQKTIDQKIQTNEKRSSGPEGEVDPRQNKMNRIDELVSLKKYKNDESKDSEGKGYFTAKNKANRGYVFDSDTNFVSVLSVDKNAEEIDVDDMQFEKAFSEEELEKMVADSELKIIIEKTDSDNSKRMAGFEDLYETEITLSVEKDYTDVDKEVQIFLFVNYLNEKISLNLEGTVIEVENSDDPSDLKQTLIIEIHNYDSGKLEAFMQIYFKRQQNIQKFISLTKGVA